MAVTFKVAPVTVGDGSKLRPFSLRSAAGEVEDFWRAKNENSPNARLKFEVRFY